MNKLVLTFFIATAAFFASTTVSEGCFFRKCCQKKQTCREVTVETCRHYFSKTKCICGCPKTIRYVEITYQTTNSCTGECKTWTKVYRS